MKQLRPAREGAVPLVGSLPERMCALADAESPESPVQLAPEVRKRSARWGHGRGSHPNTAAAASGRV